MFFTELYFFFKCVGIFITMGLVGFLLYLNIKNN